MLSHPGGCREKRLRRWGWGGLGRSGEASSTGKRVRASAGWLGRLQPRGERVGRWGSWVSPARGMSRLGLLPPPHHPRGAGAGPRKRKGKRRSEGREGARSRRQAGQLRCPGLPTDRASPAATARHRRRSAASAAGMDAEEVRGRGPGTWGTGGGGSGQRG